MSEHTAGLFSLCALIVFGTILILISKVFGILICVGVAMYVFICLMLDWMRSKPISVEDAERLSQASRQRARDRLIRAQWKLINRDVREATSKGRYTVNYVDIEIENVERLREAGFRVDDNQVSWYPTS